MTQNRKQTLLGMLAGAGTYIMVTGLHWLGLNALLSLICSVGIVLLIDFLIRKKDERNK